MEKVPCKWGTYNIPNTEIICRLFTGFNRNSVPLHRKLLKCMPM